MLTRRQFGKSIGSTAVAVVGVGAISELTMGLSCANVFVDIEKYVPIGLSAFQTVVSLVDPPLAVPVAAVIALVKAGFADLQVAVINYQNAPAANKASLLGEISTAITAVQNEIQTFWNDVKLPDGQLATTVSGLLGVILSTLASFLPSLPAPTPAVAKMGAGLTKLIPYTPVRRSPKQFKADFNAILIQNGHEDKKIF